VTGPATRGVQGVLYPLGLGRLCVLGLDAVQYRVVVRMCHGSIAYQCALGGAG
jgi:hypothetical protein